jgi:hypothetical protein
MHILKQGNVVLTIFLITTIVLFVGLQVVRSYAVSNDIVHQQYRCWHRYYCYEGCLEYALAYFYAHPHKMFEKFSYRQGKNVYELSLKINDQKDSKMITIIIEHEKSLGATWSIVMHKNGSSWIMRERTLTIDSLAIDSR